MVFCENQGIDENNLDKEKSEDVKDNPDFDEAFSKVMGEPYVKKNGNTFPIASDNII